MTLSVDSVRELRVVAVAAGVALQSCAVQAPLPSEPPAAVAALSPDELRERMRGIAKTHCGSCHQSSRPTANPKALAVHDLDSPSWPSTLSRSQLEGGFTRRLQPKLDAADQALLRAFVAAEDAQRPR